VTKKAPSSPAPRKRSSGHESSSSTRRTPQPPPKAQPPAHTASPTPVAAPALGQILTEEQKSEYRRSYEVSSEAARKTLSPLSVRKLTPEQKDTLARVQSFLRQADEARGRDWSLAAQLARRAELLAQDLVATVR
jgi:hypothetical protein